MNDSADALQERLARYALSLSSAQLPPETVLAAKMRVTDTFGALLAGFNEESSRIARRAAREIGPGSEATIIGTADRAALGMAAFANAAASRCAELNDTYHWPGSEPGHPSDVIMPLFAVGEWAGSSGMDLIVAVTLGYEVYLRLADNSDLAGRFDQVNFAVIGVAAGAGKLLGLTERQLRQALSLAAVPNCALRQTRYDKLSMWKALATGQAGMAGIMAARLALAGIDGPYLPFEGRAGWLSQVAHRRPGPEVLGGPQAPFKIHDSILKRRGCCGTTMSSAVAAEDAYAKLQAAGAGARDIATVTVETYGAAKKGYGEERHHWAPTTRESADHSIPYVVAVTLCDGVLGPGQFDDAHLADDRVRGILDVLDVAENPCYTEQYDSVPVRHRTSVRVTTRSGLEVSGESGAEHGDIGDPLSKGDVTAKFLALTAQFLGAPAARRAVTELGALDKTGDLRSIARLFAR